MLLREQEYTRQVCRDRVMGHLRESGDFPLMCLLCLQQLQLGVAVPLPIVDGDGADGRAHRIRDDVQGEQHEEGERVPLRERFAGVESQQQGDDRSDKTPDRPLGGCRIRERAYGQRCEHVNDGAGIR